MPASKHPDRPQLPGFSGDGEAAIYVHWPFCERKCPYCDFNSHVREQIDQKAWRDAMLQEINTFAEKFPNLKATSIFFGGGTPSLMPPDTTAAIIEAITNSWCPDPTIEITLEANPSSVEAARFRDYSAAGVNRVSVGIQSLNDTSLKFLGRLHSANEALNALEVARDNFERVSFDLIYALPHQTLEEWQAELQQALSFSPSHLSLYQLTIEEGTAFYHQFHRGKFSLPDEDEAAALYDLTQQLTDGAGLPAYEVSNHARLGEESQHNLTYWRGGHYVGIGPGAHGRLPAGDGNRLAHQQIKRPEGWLNAVDQHGLGLDDFELVTAEEVSIEKVMMGLRLREGVSVSEGALKRQALEEMVASGHLAVSKNRVMLTDKGRPLLNFLLGKLLA